VDEICIVMGLPDSDLNLRSVPVCVGMVHGRAGRLGGEGGARGHGTVAPIPDRGWGGLVAQGAGGRPT